MIKDRESGAKEMDELYMATVYSENGGDVNLRAKPDKMGR